MVLLALGGIIFTLVRWKSGPRAALMTAIALFVYLIDMVALTVFLYWYPQLTESWHLSPSVREWVDVIIFFLEDFVTAAMIILLTAAAFSGRNKTTNRTVEAS